MGSKPKPGTPKYREALAKSQGEIKEDKSAWSKLIAFERNNPKVASALKVVPVVGATMEGIKNGTSVKAPSGQFNANSTFIKSLLGDALLAVNAGAASKAGLIPTLMTEAGGAVGAGGSNYLGQVLDEKLGTSWLTPALTFVGGVAGGAKGYKDAQRLLFTAELPKKAIQRGLVSKEFVEEAAVDAFKEEAVKTAVNNPGLPHNVGWAPAERKVWYHHSNTPVTTFKVPFKERWDVVNHGADPYLVWLTKENGTGGMMAERPYHQQFEATLKKPMVQVGEVKSAPGSKNSSRNAIVKQARDMGADAVIFDGIADNKLKGQQVVAIIGDKSTPVRVHSTQRAVEVQSPKNKQGGIKILDEGREIGSASYKIEDGYVIPTSITKIDSKSPYVSVEAYDGMVRLAKSLGLYGVRSGDYLVSPEATRKVLSRYNKQGALKHLDFLGMDAINGPGQPRVIITEELLNPERIVIKQHGGQIKPNFIQRLEDRKKFRNFRMTLPKNLRPLSRDYNMRRYWELHGKPDGFYEALTERDGMFSWESDGVFHANTVAPLNEKGEGEFMKSKNHRSLFHEVDWYNKGITYDDNGNPQPLTGEDRKQWENFRKQYDLDTSKRFYKYVPKTNLK